MKPGEILQQHKLKRTHCREGIIAAVMQSDVALSEHEIKDLLGEKFDRTTFYRSFKTLQDNRILHKVVVDNQVIKYALDQSAIASASHAHFYCENCDKVKCLETVQFSALSLPDGFRSNSADLIIKGVCNQCTSST